MTTPGPGSRLPSPRGSTVIAVAGRRALRRSPCGAVAGHCVFLSKPRGCAGVGTEHPDEKPCIFGTAPAGRASSGMQVSSHVLDTPVVSVPASVGPRAVPPHPVVLVQCASTVPGLRFGCRGRAPARCRCGEPARLHVDRARGGVGGIAARCEGAVRRAGGRSARGHRGRPFPAPGCGACTPARLVRIVRPEPPPAATAGSLRPTAAVRAAGSNALYPSTKRPSADIGTARLVALTRAGRTSLQRPIVHRLAASAVAERPHAFVSRWGSGGNGYLVGPKPLHNRALAVTFTGDGDTFIEDGHNLVIRVGRLQRSGSPATVTRGVAVAGWPVRVPQCLARRLGRRGPEAHESRSQLVGSASPTDEAVLTFLEELA